MLFFSVKCISKLKPLFHNNPASQIWGFVIIWRCRLATEALRNCDGHFSLYMTFIWWFIKNIIDRLYDYATLPFLPPSQVLGFLFFFFCLPLFFLVSLLSLSLCLFVFHSLMDIVSQCVAGSLWMGWRCPGQTFASADTEWLNTRETNTTSPTHRGTASLSKLVLCLYIQINNARKVKHEQHRQ